MAGSARGGGSPTAATRALERAVETVVEALIWLSTQGRAGG
ncbi:MAG TPA: hypothetical protein VGB49_00260 [Caulobacteraceae bacterium]